MGNCQSCHNSAAIVCHVRLHSRIGPRGIRKMPNLTKHVPSWHDQFRMHYEEEQKRKLQLEKAKNRYECIEDFIRSTQMPCDVDLKINSSGGIDLLFEPASDVHYRDIEGFIFGLTDALVEGGFRQPGHRPARAFGGSVCNIYWFFGPLDAGGSWDGASIDITLRVPKTGMRGLSITTGQRTMQYTVTEYTISIDHEAEHGTSQTKETTDELPRTQADRAGFV